MTLRGTFGHPLDVQFLKNQVADIEGVIALEMLAADQAMAGILVREDWA